MTSLKILFLIVSINVFGSVRSRIYTTEVSFNSRTVIIDVLNHTHSDQDNTWRNAKNVYAFTVKDINGKNVPMSKYKGKVMIIINLASKCRSTEVTYQTLNEIYEKYSSKGLVVLGFPSNQFHKEPGTNAEICKFAKEKHVKFPMFAKIDVNGDNASPLWKYIKSKAHYMGDDMITWNFNKFIVNREGKVIKRISNLNPLNLYLFVSDYMDH